MDMIIIGYAIIIMLTVTLSALFWDSINPVLSRWADKIF